MTTIKMTRQQFNEYVIAKAKEILEEQHSINFPIDIDKGRYKSENFGEDLEKAKKTAIELSLKSPKKIYVNATHYEPGKTTYYVTDYRVMMDVDNSFLCYFKGNDITHSPESML